MGSGSIFEWKSEEQLEWAPRGFEMYAKMRRFTSQLNHFYKEQGIVGDDSFDGLEIDADNRIRASCL